AHAATIGIGCGLTPNRCHRSRLPGRVGLGRAWIERAASDVGPVARIGIIRRRGYPVDGARLSWLRLDWVRTAHASARLTERVRRTTGLIGTDVDAPGSWLGVKALRYPTDATDVVILDRVRPPAVTVGHVGNTLHDTLGIEP